MYILSIESSCDETSSAIVEMGEERRILSNIVASQIDIHALYGGVVPEIAGRAHIEAISRITYEALEKANLSLSEISAVAVTNRPGLIGALLVGVNFAKSLAVSNGIPLVPVNHIKGHIAANYLCHKELEPPFFALVASGGHTSLIEVNSYTDFKTVGRTRDDAMGEAFDKVARVMGIPYPGGAEMDRLASLGNPDKIAVPSAAIADGSLDFSFSGLKTHVINYLHTLSQRGEEVPKADIAAAFTKSVTLSVIKKLDIAFKDSKYKKLVLA
ncbi:MAG: tRNA (adenosine(37)-N6)-threonylcarbamoyltransferase complex transferase subunit TsaD, partial [Clostridia bacterium]|nr:tRNA (adenosine(37)-N6)-threonylcarbamoyltransferase complex transferase subunit TsaD [Clostridia bacterium]